MVTTPDSFRSTELGLQVCLAYFYDLNCETLLKEDCADRVLAGHGHRVYSPLVFLGYLNIAR